MVPVSEPPAPIDRPTYLKDAVNAAYQLLHYAVETGQNVPEDVRNTITVTKMALNGGPPIGTAEEGAFLNAYQGLAQLMKSVSARSLRETDDAFAPRGRIRTFLRLPARSEAKRFSARFALLAVTLILCIAIGEFFQNFARNILANQADVVKLSEEHRKVLVAKEAADRQLKTAESKTDQSTLLLRETLMKQQSELREQLASVAVRMDTASTTAIEGYVILARLLRVPVAILGLPGDRVKDALPHLILPLTASLGEILLPLLYGALGACAFILRSVVVQIHERSFERRRAGDYGARVYLGMLSGVTLQWVFVGGGRQIPGGFTPAVLAFAGGYSVEVIFAVFDRIIKTVTETIRPPGK